MNKEEEIQDKFYFYQILKSQEEHLEEQINSLGDSLGEIFLSENCLEEIKKQKKDIFPSLGNGIFLIGEKALVEIGAGVFVKKSLEDAEEILKKRKESIEKSMQEMSNTLLKIKKKISELEEVLEREINQSKYK